MVKGRVLTTGRLVSNCQMQFGALFLNFPEMFTGARSHQNKVGSYQVANQT